MSTINIETLSATGAASPDVQFAASDDRTNAHPKGVGRDSPDRNEVKVSGSPNLSLLLWPAKAKENAKVQQAKDSDDMGTLKTETEK